MPKFRVTDTTAGTFQDGEGALPFDVDGLGNPGATVRARVWNTSAGASVVIPPYNVVAPEIDGTPDVSEVLSMIGDGWTGADDFNYWWYADGVEVATTETYTVVSGDRGKTITAAKQAQGVNGSDPSAVIAATNSLFIPADGGDGTLTSGEYIYQEAVADVDTRKTYVEIYDDPPADYEWVIYRGTAPDGVISTVATPTLVGDTWAWTSTGQATVGTGPDGRTTVYVRIGLRETLVPANAYFVTPAGEFFLASSIPGAPVVSYSQGAGQGEIYVDITGLADGAGRPVERYEYQLNGGTWMTLTGGLGLGQRVISTGVPTTAFTVSIRAVNTNGNGTGTTPTSATTGAVSVVPLAFGPSDWSLVDKPSAAGDKLTLAFTVPPADGGSALTDVQYQINAGGWTSIGTTPTSLDITVPATTLANVQIRAVNSVGDGAEATKSATPTTLSAANATAYFGALTVAGAGSWKPETTAGDEIELTGIVSQVGMTRTWSIVSGGLVANGTPDVDDTKSLTVSTAVGNTVVTISTVANAWSVANAAELATALATAAAGPRTIFLRPRLYDLGRGPGSSTPTGNGILHRRIYTSGTVRTMDKHPGQVRKPYAINTTSLIYDTAYLVMRNFKSIVQGPNPLTEKFLIAGKSTGVGTRNFTMQFCDCEGPEVPESALQDPVQWPDGYTGILHQGLGLSTSNMWDTVVEDCTFTNMRQVGSFHVRGAFIFRRNSARNIYFDCYRFVGPTATSTPDNGEAKIIADNTAESFFAINNEMAYIDPETGELTNLAPHNDFMQIVSGTIYNALIARNVCARSEPIRGDVLQGFFSNAGTDRCVLFQNILSNRGSPWGLQLAQSWYCVVANNTIIPSDLSSCQMRLGVSGKGVGEHVVQNTYLLPSSATTITGTGGTVDALIITELNNLMPVGGNVTDDFDWLGEPVSVEQIMEYATPKVGSDVATLGIGALDTSGGWNGEEWPPLAGAKPTVADAGADLLITPSASKLAHTTPTEWDIAYRNASATPWTYVTGEVGANYTLVAPTKAGIQVMTRWIGTNGLVGPWSEAQTVIV